MVPLQDNLKRLRHGKFTQHGLAAASTVSRSTIAEIERGERTQCDSNTLLRLANALSCTVDELLRPPPPRGNARAATDVPCDSRPVR
jgi:transcriptional regulator with XRE-family HTH domain